MTISFPISSRYLWIPVIPEQSLQKITITVSEKRIYEFLVPIQDAAEPSETDGTGKTENICKSQDNTASTCCSPNSTQCNHNSYDTVYYSAVPVSQHIGETITIKGDFPESFAEAIRQDDSLPDCKTADFPIAHFAAPGWINDPNGLVYADGLWHLYFQYNPFDTRWQNMSWGHAVSSDLINWTQHETALFPDETGSMFSGSCLPLDKDHLLFFYTSAGDATDWGKENSAPFAQHIALSTDHGETLVKTSSFTDSQENLPGGSAHTYTFGANVSTKNTAATQSSASKPEKTPKVESVFNDDPGKNPKVESIFSDDSKKNPKVESIFDPYNNMVLDQIAGGNRDPKVYKDEINGGYYMVLFLNGNEYAIFHSIGDDYTKWENTQRFEMAPAWECPDLRLIPGPSGKTWVFWTSDGFYKTGSFDGYHFVKDDSPLKRVYLNSLAYAGQTYQIYAPDTDDNFSDRVVLIHWLRTSNKGHNYTGMMGIPREMHLNENNDLCLTPAKEWTDKLISVETSIENAEANENMTTGKMAWSVTEESAIELDINGIENDLYIDIFGQKITYKVTSHTLHVENGNIDFHKDHNDVTVPDMEPCTDVCFGKHISDLRLIMDRGILEISAESDSLNAFFEIPLYKMNGTVTVNERPSDGNNYEALTVKAELFVIRA